MNAIRKVLKWTIISVSCCLVAAAVLLAAFPAAENGPPTPDTADAGPLAASPPGPAAAATALPAPTDEVQFVRVTRQGEIDYNAGANDMMKGASRPKRAKAICGVLTHTFVHDWIGSIEILSSNNEGKGVLAVRLSRNTALKTWNNSFSDTGSNTLLEPSGPVFAEAAALTEGEAVFFSGTFFTSQTDCVEEQSLTMEGSMQDPEFLFRFTDVRPVQ